MQFANIYPAGVSYYNGAFSVTGAGTTWDALADSTDASYLTLDNLAYAAFDMTDFTLPAGAVLNKIQNVFRAALAGTSIIVHSVNGARPQVALTGALTTYTNYASDNGGVQPSTQADINTYRLLISSMGPGTALQVSQAYAVIEYALPPLDPTVSLPAAGTITTTNTPTTAWAHRSQDALAQSAYQYKVFTQAQFTAGGFDPGASTSVYDSGIVTGSAATATLPPLPTATSYRVYVRSQQIINGQTQWSPTWGASATFTISVASVSVSGVVATADNTNGRITLVATRTATPVWSTVEWQASYDAGVTWAPLRGYTSVASGSALTTTAVDYESSNGGAAIYRARGTYLLSGLPIVGAWTTSNSATWSDASPCHVWLKDVAHPARNIYVEVQLPDVSRDRTVGVFRPLGATYPVVITDVRQAGTSSLVIVTRTDVQAGALLTVAAGNVLLLQTPGATGWQWGSRYVVPGLLVETQTTPGHLSTNRVWTLALVEVARPIDDGVS